MDGIFFVLIPSIRSKSQNEVVDGITDIDLAGLNPFYQV